MGRPNVEATAGIYVDYSDLEDPRDPVTRPSSRTRGMIEYGDQVRWLAAQREKRTFRRISRGAVIVAAAATLALLALLLGGCSSVDPARLALVKDEVATLTSEVLINPALTPAQAARVKAQGEKIQKRLDELGGN